MRAIKTVFELKHVCIYRVDQKKLNFAYNNFSEQFQEVGTGKELCISELGPKGSFIWGFQGGYEEHRTKPNQTLWRSYLGIC